MTGSLVANELETIRKEAVVCLERLRKTKVMIIRVQVEIRTDHLPNTLGSATTWANLSGAFLQDFIKFSRL
jgi:hypothetical protein